MNSSSNRKPGEASGKNPYMTGATEDSSVGISSSQRRMARLFVNGLEVVRKSLDNQTFPLQYTLVLFHAAANKEPIGVLEFSKLTGMSSAATSRAISVLGRGLRDEVGLELLEAYEDPQNRSRKLVKLTPKGCALVSSLEAAVMPTVRVLASEA